MSQNELKTIDVDSKIAEAELLKKYCEAEELLKDEDKIEKFLQRLEVKLKNIPIAGSRLANIPVLASLVRMYIKKEYTNIPIGTIIAIVAALIYFVSPIDIVPDSVPILGYFDDAAVVAACWKLVESDVLEYIKWRETENKVLDV